MGRGRGESLRPHEHVSAVYRFYGSGCYGLERHSAGASQNIVPQFFGAQHCNLMHRQGDRPQDE
jgi:hypothetical protein